jgi:hypothetical protein
MGFFKRLGLGAGLAGMAMLAFGSAEAAPRTAGARTLKSFASDAALRAYLTRQREAAKAAQAADPATQDIVVTGAKATSITNTQEAGVDEGGIVNQRGDILIVLRRGRLVTVSIAGGGMTPVDRINAFPPGVTGEDDWYDEMLVHGDRVVVIGYSSDRGGTEINRFRIDDAGHLRFEDAYQLKSNDYYSSSNYASRLIGDTLIFYTPLDLRWKSDPLEMLPGMRRWRGKEDAPFKRIARADQVYIPPSVLTGRGAEIDALHTLTRCSLATPEMTCNSVGVLGASSRSFYVSSTAMYLWISDAWSYRSERRGARGLLYRLPLGSAAPAAIGVRGSPVDQFSFQERAGRLNVVVRNDGGGDAMWQPTVSQGAAALARIPIGSIGDGSAELPLASYRPLPGVGEQYWGFHNRFVGDALLYGISDYDEDAGNDRQGVVHVVPVAGGPIASLPLHQSVDRIDLTGRDGIVIGGTRGDGLGFATIELPAGSPPRLGDQFILPKASQAESRSQAFFFSPDPRTPDGASGLVGLPVLRVGDDDPAAVLYLDRDARKLSRAGELASRSKSDVDDGCTASCVDWYGNMRPVFTGGRVFALMGYELVEGAMRNGRIREVGRVDFAGLSAGAQAR